MKKIFQYIMLAVVTIVMASCTSDIEETTAATGKSNVQLVVGEFPVFGDSQTRAIGTPDEGKTSWAEGDELLLEMTSKTLGTKYAAFKYNGSSWELASGELSYKEDEVPTFPHVYYAPNYKWEAGKLVLKEGKAAGTDEYIEGKANITPNGQGINVSFTDATRNYSRLRIATMPNKQITVDIDQYIPAGSNMERYQDIALTSDEKGNAYLYGTFGKSAEVTVKYGRAPLATYKFSQATVNAKSYVLDATVISANSAEEIKSAIEQEIANSKYDKNVILTLPSNASSSLFEAINTAIKNSGVEDGTVNLTLMGVMTIPENAFNSLSGDAPGLLSVYLPDVTIIKSQAFEGNKLREIDAPNVEEIEFKAFHKCTQLEDVSMRKASKIGLLAFSECRLLRSVWFGALSSVMSYSDDGLGGIFDKVNTTNIQLTLSTRQAKLGLVPTYEAKYEWYPTGQSYWDSEDYSKNKILGYTFRRIIRADD